MNGAKQGPGYGRRWLEAGEILREGVLVHDDGGKTRRLHFMYWGDPLHEKATPCSVPIDVGEGFRLLEPNEEIQVADSFRFVGEEPTNWEASEGPDVGLTVAELLYCLDNVVYRRPVTAGAKPEPAFQGAQAGVVSMTRLERMCAGLEEDVYKARRFKVVNEVIWMGRPEPTPVSYVHGHKIVGRDPEPGSEPLPGPDMSGDDVGIELTAEQLRAFMRKTRKGGQR